MNPLFERRLNEAINFATLLSCEELEKIIKAIEELILLKEFLLRDTPPMRPIVDMLERIIENNFLIEYFHLMTMHEMKGHLQTFKDAKKIQSLQIRIDGGN